MKLIAGKYRRLKPTKDYLFDEVVIAQAWKKTHGYIRAFNWYADTLALDISALCVEENAKNWAQQLQKGNALYPLELVPAAKSETWFFDEKGWRPSNDRKSKGKTPLRPLAHLAVRDQTWASAAMLCLADAVESIQGDCSHKDQSFDQARNKGVYSYGNRLVCDWKEDQAWFRWGNSETYRKFFVDYQSFLKRPIELGRQVIEQGLSSQDVYIVNLDLQKFYNTIDKKKLIERLKDIVREFGGSVCKDFWKAFEDITAWHWSDGDLEIARTLKLGNIKEGLPQGLVASGFFANAYLAEFDSKVGDKLGRSITRKSSITLYDYCRYVDDLRLVVSVEGVSAQQVKEEMNTFFSGLLKRYGGEDLKINPDKTKVTLLSDLDNKGSMASRIETIQSELSGPTSRDTLDSTMGILESLLDVDEIMPPALAEEHEDFPLLNIANFDHDIRPDTLKRFAANRLESIVKSKRNMRADKTGHIRGVNNEDELLAKKLIHAWMKDPSLAIVLRKAIEIYPDADLFEPVVEAIFQRSSLSSVKAKAPRTTSFMMDYLLADLFRCAIDFNGYSQTIDYSSSIQPKNVIELVARYAQKVIASPEVSNFILRQALMLLAVTGKTCLIKSSKPTIQHDLHAILMGTPSKYQFQRAALFEVAAQITDQFDTYASLFLDTIKDLDRDEDRVKALEVFAKRGGPYWLSLWKQLSKKNELRGVKTKLQWAAPHAPSQPKPRKQLLSKVITSEENGFEFEHAQIKLALGLIDLVEREELAIGRSPNEISVNIASKGSWRRLWCAEIGPIKCELSRSKSEVDPRFSIPYWVEDDYEIRATYWIGMILRSSVLGGTDFTGNRWRQSNKKTYKGLRTSWYKRRMGMLHSPESLVGEYSTVSNWYSDLLMRCLQWPGFESTFVNHEDVRAISDIDSLKECLKARLKYLNTLICNSSSLPMIPTDVKRPTRKDGFRIVTVQQLLPKAYDFSKADVELNNPAYRAKHEEHLRDVCSLTVDTLEAKLCADNKEGKPSADLIVFPEVAVHIDDQAIIKRLADKTGAIVFAGLVFTDLNGQIVNIARWFIPDYRDSGRQWIIRDQGKQHMTSGEKALGVTGCRPCQHMIEIHGDPEGPFRLTGAICYDATDIQLAADLKDKTDLFVISAHNKDVNTFDNMASALHYHMYQHVVISNIGEYGGSTIQAPFKQPYDRLISHVHGVGQISINTADIDLAAFKRTVKSYKRVKTRPAGS